jgi:hypothetical protein
LKSFTAVVQIAGINPYVDVPARVVEAVGGGRAPVLIRLTGSRSPTKGGRDKLASHAARLKAVGRLARGNWFRSTLVPVRAQPARLYLDAFMRDHAAVGVGDRVRVSLKADRGSREIPLPRELRQGLDASARARAAWAALTPSRRREILTYLNFLKTDAARKRRVRKTLEMLRA